MKILRLLTRDIAAFVGALFLTSTIVVVVGAQLVLGDRAQKEDFGSSLQPPGFDHGLSGLLGTDTLGRSTSARLLEGGYTSLLVALTAGIVAAVLGSCLGLAAGYRGGLLDSLAMRLADVILSFPMLLLAMVFLYVLEPRPANIVVLLVISRMPAYLRVVRAETKELRTRLFVDVARCRGASGFRICRKEIAPMVVPTVVTLLALDVGFLMLIESALSYLGVGIQAPSLSWGSMVADGRDYIATSWWLSFFPGLAIFLFALSSNMLSNWIRIATDPAQRWRLEKTKGSAAMQAEPQQLSVANAMVKE